MHKGLSFRFVGVLPGFTYLTAAMLSFDIFPSFNLFSSSAFSTGTDEVSYCYISLQGRLARPARQLSADILAFLKKSA
jgi:hypothetical protein